MTTLFQHSGKQSVPLAEQLRPRTIEEVVGQEEGLSGNVILRQLLQDKAHLSLLLWGPPGCGKTTIARIVATHMDAVQENLSAVSSGIADMKVVFERARKNAEMGKRTVLFIDEIHRFNRAQQDALLPVVEDGTVMLIGATTENPSFELNAALLSRMQLVVLSRLSEADMARLLMRAEEHLRKKLPLDAEAREHLIAMADGDARTLYNFCEVLFAMPPGKAISREALVKTLHKRAPLYDKKQDAHYNLISALHKSLRGSDVDAALYWLCRMLAGGEDPLYIVRRLVRFAVEDIGMADPQALIQANAAKEAYDFLGSPEGELAIVQCVVYLATAPKSNAQYKAYGSARRDAEKHGSLTPPAHILNAPTKMMKELGYGKDYAYDHDTKDGFSGQNYFPDDMKRAQYYRPVERGFEREIQKRLDYWAKLRERSQ
ncbi:MAG: replication-associated recombination protein A [Alphaproteobacteria bacterium]|nr:replication-associated recombination protein A [Alphaproteobacteria bacterium]